MADRRTIGRWIKRGLAALFGLGLVALLVVAFLPKPVPVDLARVERGPITVAIEEDGRTRVKDRYVVSAPLSGNLARIEKHPGDAVEEGEVLARILPTTAPLLDARTRAQSEGQLAAAMAAQRQSRSTIARAEAAFRLAETEAARNRQLVRSGAVAQTAFERSELEERSRREELTSVRFAARIADYEVQMAQATLGRMQPRAGDAVEQMEVPSPIAGRVLRVLQESEGVVGAGQPLLELGDPAALEIVVDVLTSDAVQIRPGARVVIDRWGGEETLDAHVRLVEPSAFTRVSSLGVEEQRVNAVIDLDEPHDRWRPLGDGYRVEARIIVWEEDDVLHVPSGAVFRRGDGWAVYLARDGAAVLTPIEVGRRSGLEVQITDGLSEGDRVIIHPSDRVEDGVSITSR